MKTLIFTLLLACITNMALASFEYQLPTQDQINQNPAILTSWLSMAYKIGSQITGCYQVQNHNLKLLFYINCDCYQPVLCDLFNAQSINHQLLFSAIHDQQRELIDSDADTTDTWRTSVTFSLNNHTAQSIIFMNKKAWNQNSTLIWQKQSHNFMLEQLDYYQANGNVTFHYYPTPIPAMPYHVIQSVTQSPPISHSQDFYIHSWLCFRQNNLNNPLKDIFWPHYVLYRTQQKRVDSYPKQLLQHIQCWHEHSDWITMPFYIGYLIYDYYLHRRLGNPP